MIEWSIVLILPVLIALAASSPRWDRAWIFLCSIYFGTFSALALLPWTLEKLGSALSPHHPCALLIVFFAPSVLFAAVLYKIFRRLLSSSDCSFPAIPGAAPQRLMLFCGSALLFSVFFISVSALPAVDAIPLCRSFHLRKVGTRIVMSVLPTDSLRERIRTEAVLRSYPEHLNHSSSKAVREPVARNSGAGKEESTFDRSDTWVHSPFDDVNKAKRRQEQVRQSKNGIEVQI